MQKEKSTRSPLWIEGGRVIDPSENRDEYGSIYAVDGKIVNGLSAEQKAHAHRIDASSCIVCPGFVDIHVHLRDPGQTHKEDIGSGTQAAAAGGFTSIVCMPNTSPPVDNVGILALVKKTIGEKAVINVFPTACITLGMEGEQLSNIGSLYENGVVAITDDGACIQSNEVMRRAVEYAAMFDLCVMDHCQDAALTQKAVMHEGQWSLRLGLRGWPSAAEDIIVQRNITLAHYTGAHIHLQHISSARSVDMIRQAKAEGTKITAEATPHHLHLSDECLRDYDTRFKVNPPLRTAKDQEALLVGLLDGTLDCIATDHAPHTNDEKEQEFDYAPFGMIGLETALPVALEVLYHSQRTDLSSIIACMTHRPAEVLKLDKGSLKPGAEADITIFDPNQLWVVDEEHVHGRSSNSPWLGRELRGRVKKTIVSGKIVFEDGENLVKNSLASINDPMALLTMS